jgi:hypothetical protein
MLDSFFRRGSNGQAQPMAIAYFSHPNVRLEWGYFTGYHLAWIDEEPFDCEWEIDRLFRILKKELPHKVMQLENVALVGFSLASYPLQLHAESVQDMTHDGVLLLLQMQGWLDPQLSFRFQSTGPLSFLVSQSLAQPK